MTWYESATGFPMRCLWKWSSQYGSVREGGFFEIGKRDPNQLWFDPPGLPYLPISRGLIINTIFWAGAWWIALFGLTTFKRRHRLRRGRCANCAYDLRGITFSTCPECGHVAPSPDRKHVGHAPSPVGDGGGAERSEAEGAIIP